MKDARGQVIALAGVAQCALWVYDLAQKGVYREDRVSRVVDAILCTDPDTADAVFRGVGGIAEGLRVLSAQMNNVPGTVPPEELAVVTRHMGQLLRLAGKVQSRRQMLDTLSEGIRRAQRHQEFGAAARAAVPGLADLYTRTVSTLKPRVMVHGQPANLNNSDFVATIRVFLLCGVRAGVLWRQCGGSRWKLLLERGKLLNAANEILAGAGSITE